MNIKRMNRTNKMQALARELANVAEVYYPLVTGAIALDITLGLRGLDLLSRTL